MKRFLLLLTLLVVATLNVDAQRAGRPREVATKPGTPCNERDFIQANDTKIASLCQNALWKDVNVAAASGITYTIASGTSALATGAISSATCATAVTTSATGTATTDVIAWGFNGDPTGVTGYIPATAGMLTIIAYPSANNVNFKVCNNTSGSITPGAITLNWRIAR